MKVVLLKSPAPVIRNFENMSPILTSTTTPSPTFVTSRCRERPLDHFHLFSKLPTEVRLRIWHFNLPPPRVVPIRCGAKSLSFASHANSPPPSSSGCTSHAAVPVNLHVCHESRSEALKTYALSFGMTRNPGQIFFDWNHDVLYFGARDGYMASEAQFLTVMSLCDPADLAEVCHLAVNDSLFWVDSMYQSMSAANLTVEVLKQIRARMPRLERLVFVPRDENPIYDDDVELVEASLHGALQQRMARQMEAGMSAVCDLFPDWTPPRWSIMTLGSAQQQQRPPPKEEEEEENEEETPVISIELERIHNPWTCVGDADLGDWRRHIQMLPYEMLIDTRG